MLYNSYELLWFFLLYAFLGWLSETALAAVRKNRLINRGFLNAPFSPTYGLGGVLTPTGLGTPVGVGAEDASGTGTKESITIDGKEYLLERPIRADVACIYGSVADKYGNVKIHGTARNFNTVMATAADTVICQADEVVEMIDPDEVLIQGVLVDYIVGGKN